VIQDHPPQTIVEQPPPQRPLQQAQPKQGNLIRLPRIAATHSRPVLLDQADPVDHQLVVKGMRPAMQWQAHDLGGIFAGGQQNAVAPKVVETDASSTDTVNKPNEAGHRDDLQWQQVMPLHSGMVTGTGGRVDDAKRHMCRHGRQPLGATIGDLIIAAAIHGPAEVSSRSDCSW